MYLSLTVYFCFEIFYPTALIAYILYAALGIFGLCLLIQLYFILFRHNKLGAFRVPEIEQAASLRPLSVIICARNEYQNLSRYLPIVLEQDYPDFEVILVNDCSDDESEYLLRGFSEKYAHLKVVTLSEHSRFKHGKKFAVAMGIKAASNELLVFTDADCEPATPEWLKGIAQNFTEGVEIVLGYSPYYKMKGFLNLFIRFETFNTALNYLSFAVSGVPYMGVGRNMAYKKELFFRKKGFASHMHIPSGDDDLFVNEHANKYNTSIVINQEAQVWSDPKKTWKAYWKQKRRHMGAGRAYRGADKRRLSLLAASSLLFFLMIPLILALQFSWYIILGAYLVRLLVQMLVYYRIMKRLACPELIWYFPLMDIIYHVFIVYIGLISSFRKPAKWA